MKGSGIVFLCLDAALLCVCCADAAAVHVAADAFEALEETAVAAVLLQAPASLAEGKATRERHVVETLGGVDALAPESTSDAEEVVVLEVLVVSPCRVKFVGLLQ